MSATIPTPPFRHLRYPVAQDISGYWNTAWCYASHADDFDIDSGMGDLAMEYAIAVMAPVEYDDDTPDEFYDEMAHVASALEASFWMGRANKGEHFLDTLMTQCWAAIQPTQYLTAEVFLRAIIHGHELGRWSIGHDLDWVWGVWQFSPYAIMTGPVDQ